MVWGTRGYIYIYIYNFFFSFEKMLRGLYGDCFFSKVKEKILQILIIFNFFYYNFLVDVNFEILIIELYVWAQRICDPDPFCIRA